MACTEGSRSRPYCGLFTEVSKHTHSFLLVIASYLTTPSFPNTSLSIDNQRVKIGRGGR